MPTGVPNGYTRQDVINLAQWLIAENTHLMFRKQMELTAKLQDSTATEDDRDVCADPGR